MATASFHELVTDNPRIQKFKLVFKFTPNMLITFKSFMTDAVIIQKSVHWFAEQFPYDNGLRPERVNHFNLKCSLDTV